MKRVLVGGVAALVVWLAWPDNGGGQPAAVESSGVPVAVATVARPTPSQSAARSSTVASAAATSAESAVASAVPSRPVMVPAGAKPRGARPVGKVDRRDPGKVAQVFVTTAYMFDTDVDGSPQAGFARAAMWASAGYREYLVTQPGRGVGQQAWRDLSERQAWTSVVASPTVVGDDPAAASGRHAAPMKVELTTHAEGLEDVTETLYVVVDLELGKDGWAVTGMRLLS